MKKRVVYSLQGLKRLEHSQTINTFSEEIWVYLNSLTNIWKFQEFPDIESVPWSMRNCIKRTDIFFLWNLVIFLVVFLTLRNVVVLLHLSCYLPVCNQYTVEGVTQICGTVIFFEYWIIKFDERKPTAGTKAFGMFLVSNQLPCY